MSLLIHQWQDDAVAHEARGSRIAGRNLAFSVPPLVLAFAVWTLWSAAVVYLPLAGFAFSTNELFCLAALPALGGASLRLAYALVAPAFSNRRWTALSTLLLLVPTAGFAWAAQNPAAGLGTFALLALACGVGGVQFAFSIANLSLAFPRSQQQTALGVSAGLGNLGVALAQFIVPLAVASALFGAPGGDPQEWDRAGEVRQMWLQNAGLVWVPLIIAVAAATWFGMTDCTSRDAPSFGQPVTLRERQTRRLTWLYLGSFGSFVGYSAALPLLIAWQFPTVNALAYIWLGPLAAALVRPVGAWLADVSGAARVAFWCFTIMAAATCGVLYFLPGPSAAASGFYGFLVMFLALFVAAGIGNGATFALISSVCEGSRQSAVAALALASAVGSYGGFFIPAACGAAIAFTGGPDVALWTFLVFYASCVAVAGGYLVRGRRGQPVRPVDWKPSQERFDLPMDADGRR